MHIYIYSVVVIIEAVCLGTPQMPCRCENVDYLYYRLRTYRDVVHNTVCTASVNLYNVLCGNLELIKIHISSPLV